MFIAATHTLHVQTFSDNTHLLINPLTDVIEVLKETPECLAYTLTRDPADARTWLITGHWQSVAAMEAHFQLPALNELLGLLQCNGVRGIQFNSVVVPL